MSLKAKIEAIIYAAEDPVTVDQIIAVVADEISSERAAAGVETALPIESSEEIPQAEPSSESQPDPVLADAKQQARQQREDARRRVREILEQLDRKSVV